MGYKRSSSVVLKMCSGANRVGSPTLLPRGEPTSGGGGGDLRARSGQWVLPFRMLSEADVRRVRRVCRESMNHHGAAAPGGARRCLICPLFGNWWSFPRVLAFICSRGL